LETISKYLSRMGSKVKKRKKEKQPLITPFFTVNIIFLKKKKGGMQLIENE
jgi:uncharacterized membrane protein YqgA involved in biofilm formation